MTEKLEINEDISHDSQKVNLTNMPTWNAYGFVVIASHVTKYKAKTQKSVQATTTQDFFTRAIYTIYKTSANWVNQYKAKTQKSLQATTTQDLLTRAIYTIYKMSANWVNQPRTIKRIISTMNEELCDFIPWAYEISVV